MGPTKQFKQTARCLLLNYYYYFFLEYLILDQTHGDYERWNTHKKKMYKNTVKNYILYVEGENT